MLLLFGCCYIIGSDNNISRFGKTNASSPFGFGFDVALRDLVHADIGPSHTSWHGNTQVLDVHATAIESGMNQPFLHLMPGFGRHFRPGCKCPHTRPLDGSFDISDNTVAHMIQVLHFVVCFGIPLLLKLFSVAERER